MKTIKTDFVIVGGGAAGLTAAVEAAENGASVIHHVKSGAHLKFCQPITI
jgi:succinate dehydrogenase/fumarate reductase flavoprotein subunit